MAFGPPGLLCVLRPLRGECYFCRPILRLSPSFYDDRHMRIRPFARVRKALRRTSEDQMPSKGRTYVCAKFATDGVDAAVGSRGTHKPGARRPRFLVSGVS